MTSAPCETGWGREAVPDPLLEWIDSPEDLRGLPRNRLPALASELRNTILESVGRTGGHLAAGLGVVELATALHYVFDTPRDRLIWDVGHQGYPHKFLTGRGREFPTLGRAGGLGKFLRRSESEYDVFGAGHAGTSISAATGIAEAIRRRGGTERVIAVIGDGALTAGMAFEGLNHAGGLGLGNLVVVLNDNGMSISPNVGALSAVASPAGLFEALGFEAAGAVDGHDLEALVGVFEAIRDASHRRRPVWVHCRSVKGQGYAPAERDPVAYHGVGTFDVASGRARSSPAGPPSWTSVLADELIGLSREDPRVVAITAAMAEGTGLAVFRRAHPDRFYDVGIAEQHAVTMAAGMATEGLKPVCAIYSTFLQRAYDQIVHDVCVQALDVTFAIDRAGLVGADGATHQGLYDFSYLRALPNMVVMAPRDEHDLRRMLRTAVDHPGPAALRFPRGSVPGAPVEAGSGRVEIGSAEWLRDGPDVGLLAIGASVATALEAAEILSARGVEASVLDARFVKPLDVDRITALARRTGAIVTIEEHTAAGGFGEAVLGLLAEHDLRIRVRRLAIPDRVVEHGDPAAQLAAFGLGATGVAEAALSLLRRVASEPGGAARRGGGRSPRSGARPVRS